MLGRTLSTAPMLSARVQTPWVIPKKVVLFMAEVEFATSGMNAGLTMAKANPPAKPIPPSAPAKISQAGFSVSPNIANEKNGIRLPMTTNHFLP